MTLASLTELLAVAGAVSIGAVEVYRFEGHLPQFELLQAKILFRDCMDDCERNALNTCRLNSIPEDKCVYDCSHCFEFIKDE